MSLILKFLPIFIEKCTGDENTNEQGKMTMHERTPSQRQEVAIHGEAKLNMKRDGEQEVTIMIMPMMMVVVVLMVTVMVMMTDG